MLLSIISMCKFAALWMSLSFLKGLSVSSVYNAEMLSLGRLWWRHQGNYFYLKKIIKCPFKLLQVFNVLKHLIPNSFEFATSIMHVDS